MTDAAKQHPSDPSASAEQSAWLEEIRTALLRLHKQLLDAEKLRYERTQGRIEGGMAFLQLLTTDPWFAWLRPMGRLIVDIDDAVDAKTPLLRADVHALRDRVRALTAIEPEGTQYQKEYDDAVQATPEVLIAHVALVRLLAREP
jgi:hypothetical protein